MKFLKYHISKGVSHRFLIREDIHLRPEILAPSDRRYEFCIFAQLCDISPIRYWSQPILVLFLKAFATGVGEGVVGGGGVRGVLCARVIFHEE